MLPLEEVSFGAALATQTSFAEHSPQLLDIKKNWVNQILQRFPLKNNILKDLSFLNPQSIQQKKHSSIAKIAIQWPKLIDVSKIQDLDNEWLLLRNIDSLLSVQKIFLIFGLLSEK